MDERDRIERDYWERRAEVWDRRVGMLERFSEPFGHAAMNTLGPVVGARVLDVGCGPGTTTLDLGGRVGSAGMVVGLDIAPAMATAGQRRADDAGLVNVHFLVHDLQERPLSEPFDAVYSRFGVMFFVRREAAFANLVESLVPDGRFGVAVWAPLDQNPWMTIPTLSAAGVLGASLSFPAPGEPGPFSLADADELRGLLETVGLVDVEVTECRGHLEIPPDGAEMEVTSMLEIGPLSDDFSAADPATSAAAVDAVLAAVEPFQAPTGWEIPACSLIASGRRPA